MKKVVCYSFGTMVLLAGLVADVNASAWSRLAAYGRMKENPNNKTEKYDAASKKTYVMNHNTGIASLKQEMEDLKQQKLENEGDVAVLRLQKDRLERQVVALQQAQQEQLESYGRELERVTVFCGQVQAFVK